ncbi:MerR family DNA-binding transcriptional regulator [Streptomyces sp. BG9H]|uniref:MerR family DNA-binding transcriptional regulator n=1 Tax=Streptomyces anatolicus TaxID=2675858 RepID=A0ABS6YP33_9ACTN|nr:MerR family DNA-binding transcriptional regulator [Streptomyces anatolicus]MBW5423196.1 MerR family DNA-binding transcriptional regulator [Streptomyces anatolicus]
MNTLRSIGELARRTGLSVKTIRFYSDTGIVALAGRAVPGSRLPLQRARHGAEPGRTPGDHGRPPP